MFLFYGEDIKQFLILRSRPVVTKSGRVLQEDLEEIGEVKGVLASARSYERERWKQLAHPVTHKIVVRKVRPDLRAGDVLRLEVKSDMKSSKFEEIQNQEKDENYENHENHKILKEIEKKKDFIVSAVPYDVGGLGHFTVVYCEERNDLG